MFNTYHIQYEHKKELSLVTNKEKHVLTILPDFFSVKKKLKYSLIIALFRSLPTRILFKGALQ